MLCGVFRPFCRDLVDYVSPLGKRGDFNEVLSVDEKRGLDKERRMMVFHVAMIDYNCCDLAILGQIYPCE